MADHAWGGPPVCGAIRVADADFRVDEQLGYEPDGEGEHWWLRVEKTGANTVFVASELARLAGVPLRAVGFAGLKDRNAVARQWFSIHLPGRAAPDWQAWRIDGVRILEAGRSARKLKRGRLRGNRFELIVRALEGDRDALCERLEQVRAGGVPNGFGEQRFGGNNVARAYQLFRGQLRRRPTRAKRGFYLSAARSLIFNRVLAERIAGGCWNTLIEGDVAMLDGTRSIFAADWRDGTLIERCRQMDLHPTGPLPGLGDNPASGRARAIEQTVFDEHAELVQGLVRFRLEHQRRPLRLRLDAFDWRIGAETLQLRFALPAGGFATSVLRELVRYTDARGQTEPA